MSRPTPTQALLGALERDHGGLVIVRWPTFELRDWLIEEIRSLAPTMEVARSVEDALKCPADRPVVLVPTDEREVLPDLEGSRELFVDRTQPLVLFLARDGDGARQLREHPGVASWSRGNDVDPDELSEIDVTAERDRFLSEVGESPEQWLARWSSGETERTGVNYTRAYWAGMLVPS